MSNSAMLVVSAARDGVTFIVMIEDAITRRRQVIEGVVADSEEEAIDRVMAIIERNAKLTMGDNVRVVKYDNPGGD